MNSVSTRVHFYYYLSNLPDGYSWKEYDGKFGDILYVQKKADAKTIKIATKAKRRGIPVVYDCDDNPYHRPGKDRVRMLRLADAVTTDTHKRGEQLKRAAGIDNVVVIPECIDYWPMLRKAPIRGKLSKLITFGNNSNAVNTAKYMARADVPCYHINSKPVAGAGKFIKWQLKTFVDEMCNADVCLLAHNDNLKSNLKLLVCFALGIPTIVSRTRAYADTMESVGLGWLIADGPADVRRILAALKPQENRERVVLAYKTFDIESRSPKTSGEALAKVFKRVCAKSI